MTIDAALVNVFKGRGRVSGDDHQVEVAEDKSLFIAHSLPPYTEMARQGQGGSAMNTTALAALVVRPSTVAMATLWNGEGTGGKSYIIDRAFAHNLVGVANSSYGIWLCVHPAGMTKPTADITAIKGHSGKVYNGLAVFDTGATVIDNGWFPWGNSGHAVTVTVPGGQVEILVDGRLIVPPQAGISLSVVADTTSATFTSGFAWYEKKITLE